MDRYRVAGPIKDASGRMAASVLIVAADDEPAARLLAMGDPYFASGMYETVEIAPFRAAAGTWVGGRNW